LHTIDFTTALGALLRDGARRDSFRADAAGTAEQLNVCAEDRPALLTLCPAELEAQADVLLRKRLDRVKRLAPELCAALGARLWPWFRTYARVEWQEDGCRDALRFIEHVRRCHGVAAARGECNRLGFRAGRSRIRIDWVRGLGAKARGRGGIQVLYRCADGAVREWWFYGAL
jgi:hypothetical protein